MDLQELKLQLWDELSQLDVFREVNYRQIVIRCPFCGDSRKPDSAHFYVKIDMEKEEPVLFNCFLCAESGILTPSVLRSLGIHNLSLSSNMIRYNKQALKNFNRKVGITDNDFHFKIPKPDENDERNIWKKKYIESRLGVRFSFDELVDMRTIFSLGQFLRVNHIDRLTLKKDQALTLNSDYVGFLTTRNEFINFRNTVDNGNKRYIKYNIYQNLDNTRKFYTIPNDIDLLTTKKIKINIAEGVFDIWGIYLHEFAREKDNMIYSAVCGSGFISVLKYFIQSGVIGNVDVNIFSDENHQPYFYKKMIEELSPWVDNFTLYYNTKYSDYGIPKDKFKLMKKRI